MYAAVEEARDHLLYAAPLYGVGSIEPLSGSSLALIGNASELTADSDEMVVPRHFR